MERKKLFRIGLQYFAEGEAGGSAEGAGTSDSGANISQDDLFMAEMEQKYGITDGVASAQAAETVRTRAVAQPEEAEDEAGASDTTAGTPTLSPEEEFDNLIKSDKFKNIFGQRVQKAINDRFKHKADSDKELAQYRSTLSQLASRYGKAADDYDGIMESISKDDSLIEDEALKHGSTVEAFREYRDTKQELKQLKEQLSERDKESKARADAQRWTEESKETVKKYPGFDIRKELENQDFVKFLTDPKSNYTVTEAYEHAHLSDIIASSVQTAVEQANKDAARSVQRNLSRFQEGASAKKTSTDRVRKDIRNLSDADFDEIDRRMKRGERITEDYFV